MKQTLLVSLLATFLWSTVSHASLTLNVDRLVYKESEGDASLTVHSTEERAYLIQSWLDAGDSTVKKDLPFVVTPPLFRLAPHSDNVIRIMYLGNGLPKDRESLYWLDVKGVPGLNDEESKAESRMVLAINNRIKFFFRPSAVKGDPGVAMKDLHWTHTGNTITAKNDSPFYLVLNNIVCDKENVPVSVVDNNTVIPPFGSKSFKLKHEPAGGSNVEWNALNDFGIASNTFTQRF
ncbi:molecular chaperone [Lelliottia amnigena]|uniref:fimbrial biogenesis chaperone n=1 Tax=Lelliottia amnigena TaxID=61646 RepID=UPI000F9FA2B9|nr:molecular chaperone [Lelliottia amnigena]MBM7355472.1 P pilus assembly chaperone PapD [Lelliottia amnigena]WSO17818.1 molecular chaperone [Lelliottia amnigena]